MKLRHGEMMLSSAQPEDLPELEELYSEACGWFKFDNPAALCPPAEFLRGENLPCEGMPENFELLTIRVNDLMIGYIMLYRDFPGKDHVNILLLYIGERARGSGSGTIAAKMLCRYFCQSGYAAVRTNVSLRSWGGLRFWHRLGFDRILSLCAEDELSEGGSGNMSIERRF